MYVGSLEATALPIEVSQGHAAQRSKAPRNFLPFPQRQRQQPPPSDAGNEDVGTISFPFPTLPVNISSRLHGWFLPIGRGLTGESSDRYFRRFLHVNPEPIQALRSLFKSQGPIHAQSNQAGSTVRIMDHFLWCHPVVKLYHGLERAATRRSPPVKLEY